MFEHTTKKCIQKVGEKIFMSNLLTTHDKVVLYTLCS